MPVLGRAVKGELSELRSHARFAGVISAPSLRRLMGCVCRLTPQPDLSTRSTTRILPTVIASANEAVLHAKGYPFDPPQASYCWVDGRPLWLKHVDESLLQSTVVLDGTSIRLGDYPGLDQQLGTQRLDKRFPVLAYGSNASPMQLSRKFQASTKSLIPVLRADLHEFDVVYSAHVTDYGSIPATLQSCPGTVAHIFITYLDEEQLQRMHCTEAAGVEYSYLELAEVRLVIPELGMTLSSAFAYISLLGCLMIEEHFAALAAVQASCRRFQTLTETDILESARGLISPELDLDAFIFGNILYPSKRALANDQLAHHSKPFEYKRVRPLI